MSPKECLPDGLRRKHRNRPQGAFQPQSRSKEARGDSCGRKAHFCTVLFLLSYALGPCGTQILLLHVFHRGKAWRATGLRTLLWGIRFFPARGVFRSGEGRKRKAPAKKMPSSGTSCQYSCRWFGRKAPMLAFWGRLRPEAEKKAAFRGVFSCGTFFAWT